MDTPPFGEGKLTPEQVRILAAAVGVDLDVERATALVPQAEPQFALLGTINAVDERGAEPAAEFPLDGWRRWDDS